MSSEQRLASALSGRDRIERELGRGGMATVYLAEDVRHHRKVALKVLHEELAASVAGPRFVREIEIAAQLQHPNILPLHGSGEADGLLYFVMPYVEGPSLRERIAREGHSPFPKRHDYSPSSRTPWITPTATESCTATSNQRT